MNMTILVVDDSGTMRIMFKQMLNANGFKNIILAVDGVDALTKLKDNKIDLIISDWNMPNMDGMELLKRLRQDVQYKVIPFVMATAQGDKTQQNLCRQEGANNHISKPFDAPQLLQTIKETFGLVEEVTQQRVRQLVDGKLALKMGHIQITDHLALGVLKKQIEAGKVKPKYFTLETLCMPGWNPIQDALEKGDIDGAFVLAPIAMDLFAFNVPIKMVLLAHKNGSTFVRNANYNSDFSESLRGFFKYKVVDIPHKMSIHNMLAHQFLSNIGLKPGVPGNKPIDVRFEVVPPVMMPQIMKENENVAGFMVAEPVATNAIVKGIGDLQFLSSQMWPNHPCCVVTMRDEIVQQYPDVVYELTSYLVAAGKYIDKNEMKAAEIAVGFLDPQKKIGLSVSILRRVLSDPFGIRMNDLYPVLDDFEKIQRYMHDEMGIGQLIDVEKFIDLRFANEACKEDKKIQFSS